MKLTIRNLVLIAFIIFAGCMGKDFIKPSEKEIDVYIQKNPDLPKVDKACLREGRFEVGMKDETVRFMLGEPKNMEIVQRPWAKQEKWIYKRGNNKIFFMEEGGVVGIKED